MFLIDTCSWLKLNKIELSNWKYIVNSIFEEYEIGTTHDVIEEFNYHLPNRKEWLKQITILPKDHKNFKQFVGNIFDPADASLLSLTNKEYIIVTEDPAMLAENIFARNNIIQLIEFIFLLYNDNLIKKEEFLKILPFFRKTRNITKKKSLSLKKQIKNK